MQEKIKRNKRWVELHALGFSYRDIARYYGVHFMTVWVVVRRELKKQLVEK